MHKIMLWLKKLGLVRTSTYITKSVDDLNAMTATDGGMIQGQKKIDKEYAQSTQNNILQQLVKNKKIFWIFFVIGCIFLLFFLFMGFFWWFICAMILWGWFLWHMWIMSSFSTVTLKKTFILGIVFICVSLVFVLIAMLAKDTANQSKNMSAVEDVDNVVQEADQITQFLQELKGNIGGNFSAVVQDADVKWTTKNVALIPTNAKKITTDNSDARWDAIQQYFIDREGHHGTIGFEFIDQSDDIQTGYLFDAGAYPHLMCVLTRDYDHITVGCGWGPGGGV